MSHHGFHLPSLGATDGHFLCLFLTSVYFPINSLFMSFAHFQIEFHLVWFLKFLNDLRKTRVYCPPYPPPQPVHSLATPVCTSASDRTRTPGALGHLFTDGAPSQGHVLSVLISVKFYTHSSLKGWDCQAFSPTLLFS